MIRGDAIMATGRSDYPNQINNVLGFPYIFRGALDVRATTINNEMKVAAANALAELAREDVPDQVAAAYSGKRPRYGPEYIIPVPFDPRLLSSVPPAVPVRPWIAGWRKSRSWILKTITKRCRRGSIPLPVRYSGFSRACAGAPKRVVFAEGEESQVIRAAYAFVNQELGNAILVGRDDLVREQIAQLGLEPRPDIQIVNARLSDRNEDYAEFLYARLQRKRIPAARLPAHGEHGPQLFCSLHAGARRRRCDGDRFHTQLLGRTR
jgi:malate dehydrogenase (oxaloacetate-decarboxylating)(NADP+)